MKSSLNCLPIDVMTISDSDDESYFTESEDVLIEDVVLIDDSDDVVCIDDSDDVVSIDDSDDVVSIDDSDDVVFIDDSYDVMSIDDSDDVMLIEDSDDVVMIDDTDDDDDANSELPVFDASKENDYEVKYRQTFEEVVGLGHINIDALDAQKHGQSLKIATCLSTFTCEVYDIDASQKSVGAVLNHDSFIVGVKFGPVNSSPSSIVYTGSEDGTIKLWDLRLKEQCVSIFTDNTDSSRTQLSCFDVSCDGRFLVGGTDVFLLFWDVRSTRLLNKFSNTHKNNITQAKFHPNKEKTVISGSKDGIINLFDIAQNNESDAFQSRFCANASVFSLKWLQDKNTNSVVSCITFLEDVQLWHTTNTSPYITFNKNTISNAMNIKPNKFHKVVDIQQTDANGNLMVLVTNIKGEHFQSFDVNNSELLPRTIFKNNKQIPRCTWYDYDSGVLITGGEGGILNIWAPDD